LSAVLIMMIRDNTAEPEFKKSDKKMRKHVAKACIILYNNKLQGSLYFTDYKLHRMVLVWFSYAFSMVL
jgi:hypothetical protein